MELDLTLKWIELDLRLKWIELDYPDHDLHFSSGFVCYDVSSCGVNQTGTNLIENYNE